MCPKEALPMKKSHIGDISYYQNGMVTFLEGRLNVNEEQPVGLIKLVQESSGKYYENARFHIFDCPPGTSCSMIASIEECNQLLLVTEPTPFGLNDLVLAVQAARLLDKQVAVIVNRYGSGNAMVEEYCNENNIDIVARIPYDMTIAEQYSKGGLMLDKHCFRSIIAGIFNYIERKSSNTPRR
jgi:MinD superfamily P-loop ATPase